MKNDGDIRRETSQFNKWKNNAQTLLSGRFLLCCQSNDITFIERENGMEKIISKLEAKDVMQNLVIEVSGKILFLMIGLMVGYSLKVWLF